MSADAVEPDEGDAATVLADEQTAAEIAKLTAERDAIDEQIAAAKARWLREHPGTGTRVAGALRVTVTAPTRMTAADKRRFEADYPVYEHPGLYRREIDLDAARHALAPAVLDAYRTVGARQVRVDAP